MSGAAHQCGGSSPTTEDSINSFLLLNPRCTCFLMCDVQTKLLNTVLDAENVRSLCSNLITLSKVMEIPLIVTEQYRKGLGSTDENLDISHALCVVEKTKFSMYHGKVAEHLKSLRNHTVVLFGLETHICILQTTLDLLANGFKVHIVTDACSSRSAVDMRLAIQRLSSAGAILTTFETILFELLNSKDNPHFPTLRLLAKTHLSDHPALCN